MTVIDLSHHNAPGLPVGAEAVIVRTAYGLQADNAAAEHNRRIDAAGLPRLYYWYPLSRHDPVTVAETAFAYSGGQAGRRAFMDLEESMANDGAEPAFPRYSEDYWQHLDAGLLVADRLTRLTTGIYSSAAWLNRWFTPAQQARWSARPLWVAHWRNANGFPSRPDMPPGWSTYALWQTGAGPWPGMSGNVDQSQLWPGLLLAELLFGGQQKSEATMQYLLTVRDVTTTARLLELVGSDLVALQAVVPIQMPSIPPPPLQPFPNQVTNQWVINLFSKAFGPANYIGKLTVATDETKLFANRAVIYDGPSIAEMPGLSPADKSKLVDAVALM